MCLNRQRKTFVTGEVDEQMKGRVQIRIGDYELPFSAAAIELNNGTLYGNVDDEGVGYFEVGEVHNITYHYLGETETIAVENPRWNRIEVHVSYNILGSVPQFLVNEPVVVRSKKLILYPDNPLRKYQIKRSRDGIKHW